MLYCPLNRAHGKQGTDFLGVDFQALFRFECPCRAFEAERLGLISKSCVFGVDGIVPTCFASILPHWMREKSMGLILHPSSNGPGSEMHRSRPTVLLRSPSPHSSCIERALGLQLSLASKERKRHVRYNVLFLVLTMHIASSIFINDDERGLHQDYDNWLEAYAVAPHEPIGKYCHNLTGEACPESNEGTTPTLI